MEKRTLAIDTATEACSVALFDGDALIDHRYEMLGRGHAERLVPMIGELPDAGRADIILVNCGPGSFTGVRVGIAAARALGFAWGAEVRGYSTPDLIACMARLELGDDVPIGVAMTGGHCEWFVRPFAADGSALAPLASMKPEAAAAALDAAHVAGSQAEALVALRGTGTALPLWPDARHVPSLSAESRTLPPQPIYGRAPDAKPSIAVAAPVTGRAA